MKKLAIGTVGLFVLGFVVGIGLKLLGLILLILSFAAFVYGLNRGASLGEDDPEEVFPDAPRPERHEWRNNSAKAPHAE